MPSPTADGSDLLAAEVVEPRPVRRLTLAPLIALLWLTLQQQCRARRLIVLGLLFSVPTILAILIRMFAARPVGVDQEGALIYMLIPNALTPLAALLYACGMIGDEIEDQTLTYLLVRPLRKSMIYLVKLFGTLLVTIGLTSIATVAAYAALYVGTPDFWVEHIPLVALQTIGLLALALVAYCAIFGLLSLVFRHALLLGIAYIILFEGAMANIDFVARRVTVSFYFRVLEERWLHRFPSLFKLDLETVPTAARCVLILVLGSLIATGLAVLLMSNREFRMKTPEGS